jgi:N-acetyltransferase 10
MCRYAIDDAAVDWTTAEAQIRGGAGKDGRSAVVSVKSKTAVKTPPKRKAEAQPEERKQDKKRKPSRKVKG